MNDLTETELCLIRTALLAYNIQCHKRHDEARQYEKQQATLGNLEAALAEGRGAEAYKVLALDAEALRQKLIPTTIG